MVIGVLLAIANFVFLLQRRNKPQLAGFLEIVLSSIGIGTAFAVCRLAWLLPTTTVGKAQFTVTQLDRIYLFVGAFPLIWVAAEAIIRRFKIAET
jgi:hypothetical protein